MQKMLCCGEKCTKNCSGGIYQENWAFPVFLIYASRAIFCGFLGSSPDEIIYCEGIAGEKNKKCQKLNALRLIEALR